MNKSYNFVESKHFTTHSQKWLKWLNYNESIAITFPYLNDRPVRTQQFIEYLQKETNFNPIIFDQNNQIIDEQKDLEVYIQKQQIENKVTVLVVTDADILFLPQNIKLLEYLQIYRTQHITTFTTILAFECNLNNKLTSFHAYDMLFQNHDYYPLYDDEDITTFVNFFAQKWSLNIPVKIHKLIVDSSAGSFWLAKEAVRIFRDSDSFDPLDANFVSRASSIANSLSGEEQTILLHAPKLTKYSQSSDYTHLKKIGLLTTDDECRIASLIEPINSLYNSQHLLHITDNSIFRDKLNISLMLSKHENAILMGLMSKPNTPFTRDEVAALLWPVDTEDHYSAWAIDQAAKRLRDKLVSLGLPPKTIKSIRGVGYEYRN
ncbi:MAG: helix-turn-helix domain-containing protein [bacterium]